MSLAKRKLPEAMVRLATFIARTTTRGAGQKLTPSDAVLKADVRGMFQPRTGSLAETQGGQIEMATHVFFPEERVTTAGIAERTIVKNQTTSEEFRIVMVRDFGAPVPQEYRLVRVSGVDA